MSAVVTEAEDKQASSVGARLRALREQAGLSVSQVAGELHLRPAWVEALETDDYSNLPEPAFVRGYLRAYAKLLGMDGSALVALYDAAGAADPELNSIVSDRRQAPSSRHPVMRWITLLIFLALAAMVVVWWQGKRTELPADTTTEPTEPVLPTEPMQPTESSSPLPNKIEVELPPPTPNTPVSPETASSAPFPAQPAVSPQPAQNPPAVMPTPAAVEAREPLSQPTPAAPPEQAPSNKALPVTNAQDELEFTASGSSWVEVRDAEGQTLSYALYTGGEPLRLTGKAPFSVFLGNAPVVKLRFNGQLVEHAPFIRGNNTARIFVDAQGVQKR